MRVSICIPTYNRARFLGDLFDSILAQTDYRCELEIVVSDNASSDDTAEVIARYRDRFARFVYDRAERNMGADRNYLRVVELASGDWCWLMGSDDVLEPGALAELESLIERNPGLCGLSVNRNARSFDLATIIPENAFPAFSSNQVLHGADPVVRALSHYFAYLSGQVVHRETWAQVARTRPVDQYLNAYVHVFVIAEMLKLRPEWMVVVDRLVAWRSGNDSFMADGRYRRLEIDVVGYEQIAAGVFGRDNDTYRAMRDTIATQHLRHHIVAALREGSWSAQLGRKTRQLALRHYAGSWRFWRTTAPLLLVPAGLLRRAAGARRRIMGKADG